MLFKCKEKFVVINWTFELLENRACCGAQQALFFVWILFPFLSPEAKRSAHTAG